MPNFVAVTVSAIVSVSLIVWMDFVDSFCNVVNSGFVALLSRKLRRNLKYEYNYGVGKIEAISSLACDGILICWLFRDVRAVWYFSPVICILLSVWFFIGAIQRIRESVRMLTDRTLPEEEQMKIMSVLSGFHERYEEFEFLSTRMSGNTAYIDLKLSFKSDTHTGKLENLSGRVYGWLHGQGIGREDFVLINLPRGVLPVVAIVGILRAGAAFALVEDNYAPERIAYIRDDCGCKAEIDRAAWEQILKTEPLSGYAATDDHDAAYAIYTSSTTGNPKGVLHEYGNISECIRSINYQGEPLISEKDRGALLAPLNFVASIMVLFYALYNGGCKVFIASYSTIKNPLLLKKMFLEKRISITFLTPSYVRMLGGQTVPFLKKLVVGSEPANNVYLDKAVVYNMYAMSESGFVVGVFKIDKPYSTCPIGKPRFELEYMLLDEDGNPVPDGETGELCFCNEYVRGYINLPEETAKAFVGGIYHSGDLAKKLPDGNIVLLGRSNDMIKINGNRIEPAEIEAAVKNALGVDWVAAKGFENGTQSYLCAYYTANMEVDAEKLRAELLKKLPYYMIPSYYIHIDKILLKPNGKFDRKALPEPEHQDLSSQYAAPTNEAEKALCTAFAKVLKLEKVGIHDDFYEMGGDSLASIEAIVESGLPGLEASMIFRGRTAEKIAELYAESHVEGEESDEEKNAEAMKVPHKLTTEQLYMFDYQLYTPMSTMYNLFLMTRFDKELFELPKLVKALEIAIRSHPSLLTTFSFDEDGEIVQSYDPSLMPEITVEKINEFDLNILKDNLVQPFKTDQGFSAAACLKPKRRRICSLTCTIPFLTAHRSRC